MTFLIKIFTINDTFQSAIANLAIYVAIYNLEIKQQLQFFLKILAD